MSREFKDVKNELSSEPIRALLIPSVYDPSPERISARVKGYMSDAAVEAFDCLENGLRAGIIVFRLNGNDAEILDLAVLEDLRGRRIGSSLIDLIFVRFSVDRVTAETDDDAVGFYQRYGFSIAEARVKFGVRRFECNCSSAVFHYEALIGEDNDPARDPPILREYMDKWDGRAFFDELGLCSADNALEIGVGTGRLALKAAPLCGSFTGIDLSPKTIARAGENLAGHKNVALVAGDFMSYDFGRRFDAIYSSLTFMHIEDKEGAIKKTASLLEPGGRFVLSIDKNRGEYLDYGVRRVRLYPDDPETIPGLLAGAGLELRHVVEIEFAYIFSSTRNIEESEKMTGESIIDSRCGLHCTGCEYKETCGCGGCIETDGHPFHGECPVAICCQKKGFVHCGECPDIPCELLTQYSRDPAHGDKPAGARIEQSKRWAKNG